MSEFQPGDVVRQLEVLRQIGKGGFAVVYAVRHVETGEELALKVMLETRSNTDDLVSRFIREAEVIQRFDSPHLPKVHDMGTLEDGRAFIVMELLIGRTVEEVLQERASQTRESDSELGELPTRSVGELGGGPGGIHSRGGRFSEKPPGGTGRLDAAWVARIGAQVCRALEVAHAQGVLHRDLKPANLFLVQGEQERVVVLDFGVATFVPGSTDRFGSLTKTNALVGTPHYMSPEQVRTDRASERSDLYMLGVVLYEMLTGQRPFEGETLGLLLAIIHAGRYAPVHRVAPETPKALVWVVDKALSHDPEDRYASAAAMRAELEKAEKAPAEMSPPRPSSAPTQRALSAPKSSEPQPASVARTTVDDESSSRGGAVLAVMGGALVLGLVVAVWLERRAEDTRVRQNEDSVLEPQQEPSVDPVPLGVPVPSEPMHVDPVEQSESVSAMMDLVRTSMRHHAAPEPEGPQREEPQPDEEQPEPPDEEPPEQEEPDEAEDSSMTGFEFTGELLDPF